MDPVPPVLDEAAGGLTTDQAAFINARIAAAGIIWHPCGGCGRPWPFPTGPDDGSGDDRDWRCHGCVQALWAAAQRAGPRLPAVTDELLRRLGRMSRRQLLDWLGCVYAGEPDQIPGGR